MALQKPNESLRPIIALDASILMEVHKRGVDLQEDVKEVLELVEWAIPRAVERELSLVEKKGLRQRKAVRIARKWMEKAGVKVLETRALEGDEALRELAVKGCWIATNDKALRQSLKKTTGNILFLRQGKRLEKA